MATTPNYNLPLDVRGHVPMQKTIKQGFTAIDTALAALAARVDVLEEGLNDSNSLYVNKAAQES